MAFLGGLALLGSAGEAYQSAKGKQYALDEAALDQAASKALGTIGQQLAQLGGGLPATGTPVAGGPQQPPGPQGAPSFADQPQGGPMTGASPPLAGGTIGPPQPPPAAGGGQPAAFADRFGGGGGPPQFGGPIPVRTQPMPAGAGGQQPMGMPPGGQLPLRPSAPAGGGAPQGQPSMMPGQMDLPTLSRMIQQGNPGIKPEVFARALQKGASLLHPFAQDQLRQMMIQLQQQRVGQGEERLELEREKLAEKQSEFSVKEARYNAQNSIKNDTQLQKLELERKRLESTLNKDSLAQYRAIIDAQHKIVMERIAAASAGIPAADREKLLGEESERYQDEIKGIRGLMKPGAAPPAVPATPAKTATKPAAGYPVPQEYADKPEGFQLQDESGKPYVKRGNRIVPE